MAAAFADNTLLHREVDPAPRAIVLEGVADDRNHIGELDRSNGP